MNVLFGYNYVHVHTPSMGTFMAGHVMYLIGHYLLSILIMLCSCILIFEGTHAGVHGLQYYFKNNNIAAT